MDGKVALGYLKFSLAGSCHSRRHDGRKFDQPAVKVASITDSLAKLNNASKQFSLDGVRMTCSLAFQSTYIQFDISISTAMWLWAVIVWLVHSLKDRRICPICHAIAIKFCRSTFGDYSILKSIYLLRILFL